VFSASAPSGDYNFQDELDDPSEYRTVDVIC
jgi:hypothetical protein